VFPAVPTEPPPPAPAQTPRPRPTRTPAPRPAGGQPTATAASVGATTTISTTGTTSASATSTPRGSTGFAGNEELFFRLASDWGSAFPGQEVQFTFVLRNLRPSAADGANDLKNVNLQSILPTNLTIKGANADQGADPTVAGNNVEYRLDALRPGESREITILTEIKAGIAAGTQIVTQGQLRYDGLAQPLFSNIVSVLVVGNAPTGTTTASTATTTTNPSGTAGVPTSTSAPYPIGSATAAVPTNTSVAPTATRGSGQPTLVPTQPAQPTVAGGTGGSTAPLPTTSTGVPLAGVLLLGMTLITRTWRLHRSRERV
jgi:hypothetical protein